MRLPHRTLMDFLATPLTPADLTRLREELTTSFARLRWQRRFVAALFVLCGGGWAVYQATPAALLAPNALGWLLGVLAWPVLLLEAIAWSSERPHPAGHERALAADADTGALWFASSVGLVFFMFSNHVNALGPFYAEGLAWLASGYLGYGLVAHAQLATRSGFRKQLAPASEYACEHAYREALKHPEVERFRKALRYHGREYLTQWEADAVVRFDLDRMLGRFAVEQRARCQQFMLADQLTEPRP